MKKTAFTFLAILVSVTACDPYSPGQRAVGGGVLGAGAGAAVGGLAGGLCRNRCRHRWWPGGHRGCGYDTGTPYLPKLLTFRIE